ncbi:hypothetical protein LCGC14_1021770 [marine sediment metagenome]|uniref:Cytidyltransferase-like domain-containing protein n=1 Tax=marine sediment metagenome TaxID=412755 RepID=A0A0F9NIT0_9ZZZZ|nr:nicotinate-nucleotide adenylyltransferase [Actinomycetota bacterium]
MSSVSKIGIMGGTFDPIHFGHLVTAQEAHSYFGLDKVIFMPTGIAPHKEPSKISEAKQRYVMTVMATSDNEAFDVSDIEVNKTTPSFTIETLTELKKQFPDSDFYFITGADAIMEILTWKEPEKMVRMAKFVAATRPGFSLTQFRELIKDIQPAPEVFELEVPALAISSTDIRKRVREERPIRYLLPDKVWRYIYSKGFYRA